MECSVASPTIDLMDHAADITPLPDADAVSEELPEKISAFYSLVFPSFTYYVQTISVSIGRRSVRPGTPSSSDQTQVDVDLGPLKSVSRLHAKIEYEENQERFVLVVLGRNGAWVDGIWSGSGSRVPLGTRSQIQIATRVFDFVLPPAPAPEDSPSPSSPSSTTRHLSPSIDVTSLSPDSSVHSPIAKPVDSPSIEQEESNTVCLAAGKSSSTGKPWGKKRKKPGESRPPPPAVMPPRPQFTYAQLCYRAITALGGKGTLQEICNWVSENYDWYRFNKGSGWESSIRHNLSSNRAFKKMERCAGERGKGFFWSVDPRFENTVKDQEGKGHPIGEKQKQKNAKLLEPPLKRSVKGGSTSPLSAALSSSQQPPEIKHQSSTGSSVNASLSANVQPTTFIIESPQIKVEQQPVNLAVRSIPPAPPRTEPDTGDSSRKPSFGSSSVPTTISRTVSDSHIPCDVIPITVGPVPATGTSDATGNKASSTLDLSSPPIAFHQNTIILNPTIFSSLTPVHLKELESLGAKKAIEILQTYIVRFLKEKRRAEKTKGKKKKDKSKKKDVLTKAEPADGTGTNALVQPLCDSSKQNSTSDSVPDVTSSSTPTSLLSPTSGMIQAVGPLRISSPPAEDPSTDPSVNEEIDILGDDDEPALKRRKLDAQLVPELTL